MPAPMPSAPPRPAALGRQSDPAKPRKHRVFAAAGLEVRHCMARMAIYLECHPYTAQEGYANSSIDKWTMT